MPIPTGMCTHHLYDADLEAEYGCGNEVVATASTFSGDPSHDQSVLTEMEESEYERSTSDIEYGARLDVASGDDHTMSYLKVESEGGSNNPVADDGPLISTLDRKDG